MFENGNSAYTNVFDTNGNHSLNEERILYSSMITKFCSISAIKFVCAFYVFNEDRIVDKKKDQMSGSYLGSIIPKRESS